MVVGEDGLWRKDMKVNVYFREKGDEYEERIAANAWSDAPVLHPEGVLHF